MGYYVKGFDEKPIYLSIAKTDEPDIDDGSTKLEAVVRAITYAHQILQDWSKDSSKMGKNKVDDQKEILAQLGKLLMKVSR